MCKKFILNSVKEVLVYKGYIEMMLNVFFYFIEKALCNVITEVIKLN